MSIEIRSARAGDIDRIMVIERENFSVPWPREGFEFELECPESLFFVAAEGDAVAGFVIIRLADYEAEVFNIAVDSVCRRRGTGRKLLETALYEAQRKGVKDVFLEVRASNEGAKALYLSAGFEAVGLRRGYYNKPKEDAIVMMKSF